MKFLRKLTLVFFAVLALSSCACSTNKKTTIELGQISTPQGKMLIYLSEETPNHKAAFIENVKTGTWDGLTFNRVIKDFVIQGGCPDMPEGFKDSPYLLDAEFSPTLTHCYGALGAGRDDNPEKRSASCQFYIVHQKEGIPRLDGEYTIYGQLVKGFDVLEEIAAVATDTLDAPLEAIPLEVSIVNVKLKIGKDEDILDVLRSEFNRSSN